MSSFYLQREGAWHDKFRTQQFPAPLPLAWRELVNGPLTRGGEHCSSCKQKEHHQTTREVSGRKPWRRRHKDLAISMEISFRQDGAMTRGR
ncbi:hypothetical protein Y1Q_0001760 [Alligator mississippiensis]|uniref:Uncharacterized protein n=1 Tax=Alligator mississippiensis TaxID=8496 RepID=A0A151MKR1_ALLMI|nr:hypothetical protein Y1Q_0001760 [Alligator mississippiensis]